MIACLAGSPAQGLDSDIAWLTANALQERLARPISIEWSAVQLRPALRRLSEAQHVSTLIDRRVDPNARFDFTSDEQTLFEAFAALADSTGCVYSQLGPVAYFGPEQTARKLRTLSAIASQQVKQLPTKSQRIWRQSRTMRWDDLAVPRQLLEGLGSEYRIEIEGSEQIPHDLWAAADLPALSLADRMLLIAVQFDLTLEIGSDGETVRLVQIPQATGVNRRYSGRGNPQRIAQRYRKLAPNADIVVEDGAVLVRGLVEEHEAILRRPVVAKEPPAAGVQVFRLKVEKIPVARLLDHVSSRMGYTIEVDGEALADDGLSLSRRVSVDVTDATIDDLMEAILRPAGLQHTRSGKLLEIVPLGP